MGVKGFIVFLFLNIIIAFFFDLIYIFLALGQLIDDNLFSTPNALFLFGVFLFLQGCIGYLVLKNYRMLNRQAIILYGVQIIIAWAVVILIDSRGIG